MFRTGPAISFVTGFVLTTVCLVVVYVIALHHLDSIPLRDFNTSATFLGTENTLNHSDRVRDKTTAGSTTKSEDFREIYFLYGRSLAARQLLAKFDQFFLNSFWEQLQTIDDRGTQYLIRQDFIRRFAHEYPQETLSLIKELPWIERQFLIETFFNEVTIENIPEMVASLSDLGVKDQRNALESILYLYPDLTPKQQEELTQRNGISEILSRVRARHLLDLAEDQPREAWELLDEKLVPPLVYQELSRAIIEHWVDQDGVIAIEHIANAPSSKVQSDALAIALRHYARFNAVEALTLAQNTSADFKSLLVSAVLLGWAENSPKAVVEHLNTSDELTPNHSLYLQVVEIWASINPIALYTHVELFPEGLRVWVAERAISVLSSTHPEHAAQMLTNYEVGIPYHLLVDVVDSWVKVDVDSTITWIDERFTGSDRHYLFEVMLPKIAITDPYRALLIARDVPTDMFDPGLELDVIESLARQDVQQAESLLSEVRSGVTKLAAYGAVGYARLRRGQIDEAFALGSKLPEKMRDSYNGSLVGDWSIHDPRGLFLGINSIPTPQAKSRAAVYLLSAHRETHFLSDDEVEYVRSLLSDLDARVIDY